MQEVALENLIFDRTVPFEERALRLFQFQYHEVDVYQTFCQHLGCSIDRVTDISSIPFLPIELFKNHKIIAKGQPIQHVFESSGTTGEVTSSHYVASLEVYKKSIFNGFLNALDHPKEFCILALLPAYLERENASLVYMADYLMKESGHPKNGFYLTNYDALVEQLQVLEAEGQPTLLIGVTFALLDLAEQYSFPLNHTTIIETGGMKGRRKEITRAELHSTLYSAFAGVTISSEYGMTELLSQAYLEQDGYFKPASTMQVIPRELNDPLSLSAFGKTAALNIIDLSNMYSCAFIATQDIGKVYSDGRFEVLGRMDHSDLRGCNLMVV
ncbi:MAG: acyl transferase [Saprospiraceae bacterium]|nr:acyl transferase [Saprospiraceae bacterium]